jgi:hypothetical protein
MLTYAILPDRPREFLAATGRTHDECARVLPAFAAASPVLYPPDKTWAGKVRQRQSGGGAKGILAQRADKLRFILLYPKTNPLPTMHGLPCALRQPPTPSWMHHVLPVLPHAFATLGVAPERAASRVATSPLAREGAPDGVLDGTERRRQRPTDAAQQKELSSGKKKTHTDKNLVLVHAHTTTVVSLGPTVAGKTHDKKAADAAQMGYPTNATLGKDTGLQGYEPAGVLTRQPKKTARSGGERGGEVPQSSHLQRARGRSKRAGRGETVPHGQRCLTADYRGQLCSCHGDCVRLAPSPRALSSPVPHIRCAELAQLWLNPIMSNKPTVGDGQRGGAGASRVGQQREGRRNGLEADAGVSWEASTNNRPFCRTVFCMMRFS